MKSILKRLIFIGLVAIMSIELAACAEPKEKVEETVNETAAETEAPSETTVFKDGTAEITFDGTKVRQGIVDFMRGMANVEWTPNEAFSLNGDHNTWGVDLNFKKGKPYRGLPYTRAFSNLDDFAKYIEDGVYKGPCGSYDTMPGNNCSSSCDLAWREYLISDTEATYTYVPGYGNKTITAVGSYQYPDNNRDTLKIINENPQDEMFEAYAAVKPADAIVKWSNKNNAGHARMVCAEAVVMRNSQGKINGGRSYITVIEQTNKMTSVGGRETTWLVDKVYTFAQLIADGYVPVTPVALADGKTETPTVKLTDGNTSKNVVSSLMGNIETNTRISEIELIVTDSQGAYVKSHKAEIENGMAKINLRKYTFNLDIGSLPSGKYKYKIMIHTPKLGSACLQELPFEK